jgi:hypothetical protein
MMIWENVQKFKFYLQEQELLLNFPSICVQKFGESFSLLNLSVTEL